MKSLRLVTIVVSIILIGWAFIEYFDQDEEVSDLANPNDTVATDLSDDSGSGEHPVSIDHGEEGISSSTPLEIMPENNIDLSVENLKLILGDIVVRRENPENLAEFHNANLELEYILEYWSPVGLDLEQLTEILGEPDSKSSTEVIYAIKGPYNSFNVTFEVEGGLIKGPDPYLDLTTNPISEELIFRLTQRYRNISAGRKRLEANKGPHFHHANSALNNLFYFWNPDGLSVDKLKAMIGKPDWETANEFGYKFDTGQIIYNRNFIVEDGRVRLK